MAKARAIVKRRKAVRNIRKITRTMQMIATAKFQKSLKRTLGTKPFTLKVRELVRDLAASVGDVQHPLLRRPEGADRSGRVVLIVLTSNRGLCGGYNGNILRAAQNFIRDAEAAGNAVDLYVSGKKGQTYFNFQKRPVARKLNAPDEPKFSDMRPLGDQLIKDFTAGRIDAVHVAFMNFVSTGVQRAEVTTLLPLAGVKEATDSLVQQLAEKEEQAKAGVLDARRQASSAAVADHAYDVRTTYDFSPSAGELLDDLLPLTVKSAMYQTALDAATSEHVTRMVAMKSATDNAEKMVRSLTLQYNRARQSQITTELSEIMGGVESMKG